VQISDAFINKVFSVCPRKADRVIGASSEENLQPFKEKMEVFLEKGKFLIFCVLI
jgi:hypothetical protein